MGAHRTVDEHAALIRELLEPALAVRAEIVDVAAAARRVTVGDIVCPVDLPLFRNSQMDGFAVRAREVALTAGLPIVGEIAARAGDPEPLAAGTTVRIMTGAIIPEGADAVVPVEDAAVERDRLGNERVTFLRTREAGDFVRERGSDIAAGAVLIPSGTLLAAHHIAAITAAGIDTVSVRRRVRVAVITSGAELIPPGAVPRPGEVFDANQLALVALVEAAGAEVSMTARVRDEPSDLDAELRRAVAASDLVLTSGGISKGEYEVVRQVLEPLRADATHLAMQPGGPQLTATYSGVPVVSFPGNPVSTQVSFIVFVRDALLEAAGLERSKRTIAALANAAKSVAGKRQFLRGTINGSSVHVVPGASSHLVASMANATVLIDIPAETTELKVGDTMEVWTL
jgi:molybdopterin molybdotransferase